MSRFEAAVPLAIVGTACRLPGANTPKELFQLGLSGRSALRAAPPEWAELLGWSRSLQAGLVEPGEFDWRLFRLPPAQAAGLHRMEKILLQVLAAALAEARYTPEHGPGERCAIYLGATGLGVDAQIDHTLRLRAGELLAPLARSLGAGADDPRLAAVERALLAEAPPIGPDSLTTTASISAGRLAGAFDTWGGHFAVDAGAASGMAALKLASQALAAGDCDVAVVGGLSPLVSPSTFAVLDARGWLAEGALHALDVRAGGMLPGEGAAALVLRRLEDAQREGLEILAVVHAVAEASSDSWGAASVAGLVERASRAAMEAAGVEPEAVHHLEAQASGVVPLEDEELWGLGAAYAARRSGPASVSSASANVGFQAAASGLVSLVRAVESVRQGQRLPVSESLEPRLSEPRRLRVVEKAETLPERGLVGVSSHAFGGLAYHALVGPAAAARPPRPSARRPGPRKLAIVGVGAVAPGAADATTLWRNVLGRVDAIRDLPPSRFEPARFLASLLPPSAVMPQLAGVVELPPAEPRRWRLPPMALARMDRAVLLSLQAGDEALRSAGYVDGHWDKRRVRVVFGQLPLRERELDVERRIACARFLRVAQRALRSAGLQEPHLSQVLAATREAYLAESISLGDDSLAWFSGLECAGRLAARHGFSGGALSVDAACASSLVALQAASLALRSGEADVAVVGGVAFNLVPEYFVALSALGALSARGSFPFDDRADGFIPGEGSGAMVLKRLEDAEAAHDRILAVVAGIGASSDGRGHSLFAPSPDGQARSVRRALDTASVTPDWIDLVEAHGTGSRKADLCEISAYASVFESRGSDNPVPVGSIKSQIGHLSSAGGMLGLIKTTFALHEKQLPPMNGGEYPNPELGLAQSPLTLSLEARPWRMPQSGLRRAGVSAFGLGGSNVHVVLEEHDNAHLRERRVEPIAAQRPHPQPARGLFADRWILELAPVTLGTPARRPLAGKRLLLLAPPPLLERALIAALARVGCATETLSLEGVDDATEVERRVRAKLEQGFAGLIDCGGFTTADYFLAAGAEAFRKAMIRDAARWFGAGRAHHDRLTSRDGAPAIHAALTAMGGDLGLFGDAGAVLGGGTSGFLKALKHEAPRGIIKSMDFDPRADVSRVAEAVVEELEDGSDRVEVAFIAGQRHLPVLRRGTHRDREDVLRQVDPEWVLLFSGGGRGAVFEVAKGMARLGPRVIVTGRTPIPRGDEPYLTMDDATFETFRRSEMVRLKREEPSLTPVQFNGRFDAQVRARELWGNLQEAFELGLPVQYEVCDIRDAREVRALVSRIRDTYGRIDGIVHGAMLEASKSLPDKTPELLASTLDVKVTGLVNLLEATRGDALQLLMCFGSGAGRFGNRGQTDYAAANDLMAKCVMSYAHRARPGMRCVTIDWTAWENVGAAVRTRHMVETTGVSSIAPAEGVYWFLNELMLGGHEREVAIFDERLFRDWPFLGTGGDGNGPQREFDDRGRLLVASEYPLIELLRSRDERRVVVTRRFDLATDPFLEQHRLYGVPIVPGTFGLELLAEVSALARPDLDLLRGEAIEIDTPLKLFRRQPVEVELSATVLGEENGEVRVSAEVSSELQIGPTIRTRRVHFRGTFVLGKAPPVVAGTGRLPEVLTGARAKSIFHLAKDPVYLGPLFCCAEWVYVGADSVEGLVRAPRHREIFAHLTRPRFQLDPLLLDTSFQVAANWDGHHLGVVSIPMGVGRITRGRPRRLQEGAHVKARPVHVEAQDVYYDVEVRGEDGALLLHVERLWLRRLEAPRKTEPAA